MSTAFNVMRNPGSPDANKHDSWWVIERHKGGPHEGVYWRWFATAPSARRAHEIADAMRSVRETNR